MVSGQCRGVKRSRKHPSLFLTKGENRDSRKILENRIKLLHLAGVGFILSSVEILIWGQRKVKNTTTESTTHIY